MAAYSVINRGALDYSFLWPVSNTQGTEILLRYSECSRGNFCNKPIDILLSLWPYMISLASILQVTDNVIESTLHIRPLHNLTCEVAERKLPCEFIAGRFLSHVWNFFFHSFSFIAFRRLCYVPAFFQSFPTWNTLERVAEACIPRRVRCLTRRRCRVIRL